MKPASLDPQVRRTRPSLRRRERARTSLLAHGEPLVWLTGGALALCLAMIFGLLSMLNATLTLPGIAGIVLTVGIAVDSNVLIYERIREEVRAGRTPVNALDAGFSRALATILDTNITTFIAAAVLFFIGTGAVRGFAVTFGLGIITTVFTAFTLTRLMIAAWFRWFRPRTIPI